MRKDRFDEISSHVLSYLGGIGYRPSLGHQSLQIVAGRKIHALFQLFNLQRDQIFNQPASPQQRNGAIT